MSSNDGKMKENMLKMSQERVRLLKNGMEAKKIEMLYIQYNNFKIIHDPILFDFTQPIKGIAEKNAKNSEHSSDVTEFYSEGVVDENNKEIMLSIS